MGKELSTPTTLISLRCFRIEIGPGSLPNRFENAAFFILASDGHACACLVRCDDDFAEFLELTSQSNSSIEVVLVEFEVGLSRLFIERICFWCVTH